MKKVTLLGITPKMPIIQMIKKNRAKAPMGTIRKTSHQKSNSPLHQELLSKV